MKNPAKRASGGVLRVERQGITLDGDLDAGLLYSPSWLESTGEAGKRADAANWANFAQFTSNDGDCRRNGINECGKWKKC